MYRPVVLSIDLRYMCKRAADHFGRFISWLSTTDITLGMTALVTILSMMSDFEHELQNSILGLIPQTVLSPEYGSLNPQQLPETAAELDGVSRVVPITTGDAVLRSACSVAVGVMLGIGSAQEDPLTLYLVNMEQTDLGPGKYNVILGEQLASRLGASRGDQTRAMIPSAGQSTSIGHTPSQRLFNVTGTFVADSGVDGYEMLMSIEDTLRLMRCPAGNITG